MSQKLHILIVDPQNDFCTADDGHGNKGTLVVPGADADMSRLSRLIRRLSAVQAVEIHGGTTGLGCSR